MTDADPASIASDFVPRRADTAYTVELDGEAVVLDEEQNRLHLLNHTATLVWSCFDGTGTLTEIARDVAAAAEVPEARVLDEVLELTRTLGTEGLLDGVAAGDDRAGVVIEAVEAS